MSRRPLSCSEKDRAYRWLELVLPPHRPCHWTTPFTWVHFFSQYLWYWVQAGFGNSCWRPHCRIWRLTGLTSILWWTSGRTTKAHLPHCHPTLRTGFKHVSWIIQHIVYWVTYTYNVQRCCRRTNQPIHLSSAPKPCEEQYHLWHLRQIFFWVVNTAAGAPNITLQTANNTAAQHAYQSMYVFVVQDTTNSALAQSLLVNATARAKALAPNIPTTSFQQNYFTRTSYDCLMVVARGISDAIKSNAFQHGATQLFADYTFGDSSTTATRQAQVSAALKSLSLSALQGNYDLFDSTMQTLHGESDRRSGPTVCAPRYRPKTVLTVKLLKNGLNGWCDIDCIFSCLVFGKPFQFRSSTLLRAEGDGYARRVGFDESGRIVFGEGEIR